MKLLIGLILLAAATFTQADPVSQHNEPHAGIQAAIDRLDADGCTRYSVTRSGQYVLHSTTDANAYNLVGNTITIRCTRPAAPVVVSHDLTWQHANIRVDGKPLPLGEVAGYELEHNGEVVPVGVVTSYTITDITDGSDSYRIRTVDTDNQRGPWSDFVRL